MKVSYFPCDACNTRLVIDDWQATRLHCPNCGIEYVRIGALLTPCSKRIPEARATLKERE